MKILFTGASSFTGSWIVRELRAAGHDIVACFRSGLGDYEGVRRTRVEGLRNAARLVTGISFGDDAFLDLLRREGGFDCLCHHGAEVRDYKSPAFDVAAALASNTARLPEVLALLSETGCRRIVVTGSVFESGEGAGSEGLPAFSPYGLSKAFTWETFRHHARGFRLAKFVIPNPFGPLEEPRFTDYLVRCWREGRMATVRTPAYVRDNIHVSLLARCYADFASGLPETPGLEKNAPSGYVESQGAFATRFARELSRRLDWKCELDLQHQTEFSEPRVRINTDIPDLDRLGWSEDAAWDQLAKHYRQLGETTS